jgi:1-acyl-sn-glycerol-3-phosphate acyltransferase
MLQFLPSPIKGALNYAALTANTITLCTPVFALSALKLIPNRPLQKVCSVGCIKIAETWIGINSTVQQITLGTQYHVTGGEDLKYDGWYMVISNHQSWADIFVLQSTFNRRMPFFKFFLKKELIYVPIIGLVWWALDYPFMRRYSKEFIAKHPELKGKDLEVTRKACEKFKYTPVSVMNFLEGTRFNTAKHQQQQSPYKHLLKPKSAGIAYAMNIMNEHINTLVDVTIHYPDGELSFWDFMSGKAKNIHVDICTKEIPAEFKLGDYENDAEFRKVFQSWISDIWQEKDLRLDRFKTES